MVEVKQYHLPPTPLIPNSPQPLLHYPSFFTNPTAPQIHDILSNNGWEVQWVVRYGPTQRSHYHSGAHECMAVLSGSATLRFGVADTTSDLDGNTYGAGKEEGGVELHAKAGDVFILPAGTAHKTFDTEPACAFKILTSGEARGIQDNEKEAMENIEASGFTMIGAYPAGEVWDSALGGEHVGNFERVWEVRKPDKDPVLGNDEQGLASLWR